MIWRIWSSIMLFYCIMSLVTLCCFSVSSVELWLRGACVCGVHILCDCASASRSTWRFGCYTPRQTSNRIDPFAPELQNKSYLLGAHANLNTPVRLASSLRSLDVYCPVHVYLHLWVSLTEKFKLCDLHTRLVWRDFQTGPKWTFCEISRELSFSSFCCRRSLWRVLEIRLCLLCRKKFAYNQTLAFFDTLDCGRHIHALKPQKSWGHCEESWIIIGLCLVCRENWHES